MCELAPGAWEYVAAILFSRTFDFMQYTTIMPVVDVMPYRGKASVKPGKVHTDEDGSMYSIEFVAGKDLQKGEMLSFRTHLMEPVWATLANGVYDPTNLRDGYDIYMKWSPVVGRVTSRRALGLSGGSGGGGAEFRHPRGAMPLPTEELACDNSTEVSIIRYDGSFAEEMLRCAELEVLARRQSRRRHAAAAAADLEEDGPTPSARGVDHADDDLRADEAVLLAYTFTDPEVRIEALDLLLHAAYATGGGAMYKECTEKILVADLATAVKREHELRGVDVSQENTVARNPLAHAREIREVLIDARALLDRFSMNLRNLKKTLQDKTIGTT
jgi:hypothetical protein